MSRTAIICVDDEKFILSSLGEQLKRSFGQDYEIELAFNAIEALYLCAELDAEGVKIALVISDHMMPGMSGDDFLIQLHASHPKTLKILLTGRAEVKSVGKVVNAAALYRYIAKPWDKTDLILTVKEALRSYGQEEQLVRQNILLKQTNQKLSKSLNLLLATLEAADEGILVLDAQGNILVFNQQFFTLWQIDPIFVQQDIDHILGLILRRLNQPLVCNLKTQDNKNNFRKYDLLNLNNGTILESYYQIQNLGKENVGVVWGFRDVTQKERAKAIAERKALHDTLTKLPKRTILTCQLSEAITKAQQQSHLLAVMFVSLDKLKIIGKTLGHKTSDILLQKVVQRLKNCVQGEDIIARWSNDEFTLLLPQIDNKEEVSELANRIVKSLKSPLITGNKSIYIKCHIGISLYPEHGKDTATILKNADAALSQAQKFGKNNYQYYNNVLNSQNHKLFTIENLLHSALEKNEFELYYQPIVNIMTEKIEKMEALIRWRNPQLGLISPNIFIPLAEENGEIISIGEWVLETACTQNKVWQEMGLDSIKISVNLSVRQFQQPNLVSAILNILQKTQLAPDCLELEVTEGVTFQDIESAKAIIKRLYATGITLSIDDFGTGYSSLNYLKQFPVHNLKIDSAFIKNLSSSSQDMAIVNSVITLAKGFNLDVVAEGVETEELKDLLKKLGCEYIQGYFFSEPLPAIGATELLKNNLLFREESAE